MSLGVTKGKTNRFEKLIVLNDCPFSHSRLSSLKIKVFVLNILTDYYVIITNC